MREIVKGKVRTLAEWVSQVGNTFVELGLETGTVDVDLARSYDYRGRPREVTSTHCAVAADHSRCSDIGDRPHPHPFQIAGSEIPTASPSSAVFAADNLRSVYMPGKLGSFLSAGLVDVYIWEVKCSSWRTLDLSRIGIQSKIC